jgi:dTDP-4-dehydrorhamnose 3,5-epimerase
MAGGQQGILPPPLKRRLNRPGFVGGWVPRGFAHGFMTLESDTEVLYKVDGEYDPATDAGIAWDDPALGIDWPLPAGGPILSDKDRKAPRLAEIPPPFPQGSL